MTTFARILRHALPLLPLSLTPFAACGWDPDASARGWAGSIDTLESGRVVVENPETGVWKVGEGWNMAEEIRIGSADSEGPDMFGRVGQVLGDERGRMWVADVQAKEIRVFDVRGKHLRTMGRPGAGPGEFGEIAGMDWGPDGRLWVLDNGNARFSVFDTAGKFVTSHPRRDAMMIAPWGGGFDAEGRFYDVGSRMEAGGAAAPGRMRLALVRFSAAMEPADTLLVPEPEREAPQFRVERGNSSWAASVPFTPSRVWARSPRTGGIWTGENDRFEIHQVTFKGDTVRTIRRESRPVPVTGAEREEALEGLKWFTDQGGKVDASLIPGTKPAYTTLMEDDWGYLWVRAARAADEPARYDIFDREGRYLGATGPAEGSVRLTSVRGDYAYGIVLDEMDVPYVVRYRIEGRK